MHYISLERHQQSTPHGGMDFICNCNDLWSTCRQIIRWDFTEPALHSTSQLSFCVFVGVLRGEVTFLQTNYLYPFYNWWKKYCSIFLYSKGLYCMYVLTHIQYSIFVNMYPSHSTHICFWSSHNQHTLNCPWKSYILAYVSLGYISFAVKSNICPWAQRDCFDPMIELPPASHREQHHPVPHRQAHFSHHCS